MSSIGLKGANTMNRSPLMYTMTPTTLETTDGSSLETDTPMSGSLGTAKTSVCNGQDNLWIVRNDQDDLRIGWNGQRPSLVDIYN